MGELVEYLIQNDPSFRRARLPALYSDFRTQKSLNPDGYTANVTAWRSALARLAWNGQISDISTAASPSSPSSSQRLVLDCDAKLPARLESRQFGRPLALGTVIRDSLDNGALFPLQDFLGRQESIYHTSGGWSSVPWRAAVWAARQLGLGAPSATREDTIPKGRFVVLANVEKAAASVAEAIAARRSDSRFERTFTRRDFVRELLVDNHSVPPLSGTDMDVLLRFLEREKGLVAGDERTVRIRGGADASEEPTITTEDEAVAELRALMADLRHQTALLGSRVDELTAEAKAAVAAGRGSSHATALALLRRKRVAEDALKRRGAALAQLEDVAGKLEQARDQAQMVRVMESSAGALATLNREVGGVARVEGAVEALREQVAETDEVARILEEDAAASGAEAVDEAEVDAELRAMELAEQEREAEEMQKRLDEAGIVPSETVAARKEEEKEEKEKEAQKNRPLTPTTEAAERLMEMVLGETP
ncbi:hypothetical protein ACRALDRAFT_1059212 [Sodiomyces alcalophilus JCM 7366]|uniref:uncharacterized protein n=1 Tax=Sodiomyces alcalophilus JCM 7366 TaxID=591952 RepID=UPI0039B4F4DA